MPMTSFTRISCDDAHALISAKDVNVVDIRDLNSFNGGHILDAEHLDNQSIADDEIILGHVWTLCLCLLQHKLGLARGPVTSHLCD